MDGAEAQERVAAAVVEADALLERARKQVRGLAAAAADAAAAGLAKSGSGCLPLPQPASREHCL